MRFVFILSCFLLLAGCARRPAAVPAGSVPLLMKAIPYPAYMDREPVKLSVLSPNSIFIIAPPGTDLHNPASGAFRRHNAPKMLFRPGKDFVLTAKLEPDFSGKYNGGGLLLYTDTANWAKILFQHSGTKPLVGMSHVRNGITNDTYFDIRDVRTLWLQIRRSAGSCAFYVSYDGREWSLARQFVYDETKPPAAGFYVQSPVGPGCKTVFSNISYDKL